MSLEELKAQAEEEERRKADEESDQDDQDDTQDQDVDDQDDLGDDDDDQGDDDKGEDDKPSDDFELELDGEPDPDRQSHDPVKSVVHKLTKTRKRAQAAESEAEKLQRENEELKAQLAGRSPQTEPDKPQEAAVKYPPVPVLYENGLNTQEQYNEAYQKWWAECRRIDQESDKRNTEKRRFEQTLNEKKESLANNVVKFMQENKISEDRVVSAIETATEAFDDAMQIEGTFAWLMDSVGDGSERVAYYLGTNENARGKILELMEKDPSGLKATAEMTRMAVGLKPKKRKQTSQAPEPDEAVRGDGSSPSARKLQEAYDKASDKSDLRKMRDIKRKAEAKGVTLK